MLVMFLICPICLDEAVSFNQSIGAWDVSSVTNTSYIFYGAIAFNQDISGWDVSNVVVMIRHVWYSYEFQSRYKFLGM